MAGPERWTKAEVVEDGIKDMKIKNGLPSHHQAGPPAAPLKGGSGTSSPHKMEARSASHSPKKVRLASPATELAEAVDEDTVGGHLALKTEPAHPPKLARTGSHKIATRSAPRFDHLDDKTDEATALFQLMVECIYSAKYLGSTEHAMECDCAEEWDAIARVNGACGEDSDCINRATKMECMGDCGCGADCQNQRFQQRQYAAVSVIQTEKKGYGLRANADLRPGQFIFEYLGEVINEGQFRRRMLQYDDEGIKHFYFMSLSKGEFVDATKKGNLGRFCNHSCNPNCYVDKWVVGDKLRMGIFAERQIQAGEELVFNYNVDRYGADPQPCYCAEPNCTGFIGGKTQTERATKLSHTTMEALGIDDGDGWDTTVAKRPRKKKAGEDDEDFVNNMQPKLLDESGVTTVMATLLQCKEKWIAVKLLGRIQSCSDERVVSRVVKMHGYQILNSTLSTWKEDFNVVLQILDILNHFPRLTKNKISDSKIETTVATLDACGDARVEAQAAALLAEWSTLETAYRIPRKKRDPALSSDSHNHHERRKARDERRHRSKSRSRSRSRSKSIDAPRGPAAPTGPRSNVPQRNAAFYTGARPPFRPRPFNPLPAGWFTASANGSTYYYSASGETTWVRPTQPANQPPPPPKAASKNKALEDIINEITSAKANTPLKVATTPNPTSAEPTKKGRKEGKEKWRGLTEEKQKKLYENTLFPHIKHVMDKYKTKLPREDLKRFAKEISKKLVNSDYKNNRVKDPTKIDTKQEQHVKKYVKDFFDKAVVKKQEHDRKKAERKANGIGQVEASATPDTAEVKKEEDSDDGAEGMDLSEDEEIKDEPASVTPITPLDSMAQSDGLKRKRQSSVNSTDVKMEDGPISPSKLARPITPPAPPPPPPPPPLPTDGIPLDEDVMEDEDDITDETNGTPLQYRENCDPTLQGTPQALGDDEMACDENIATLAKKGSVLDSFDADYNNRGFDSKESPSETNGMPSNGLEAMHPDRLRYLEAQGGA